MEINFKDKLAIAFILSLAGLWFQKQLLPADGEIVAKLLAGSAGVSFFLLLVLRLVSFIRWLLK